MPVYELPPEPIFPPVDHAEDGLLAIGGDLSPTRLLEAYRLGIFPWYSKGEPILWWSPDPRFVLFPEKLKVPKSMRPILNSSRFRYTRDKNFEEVIENCQKVVRNGQKDTWITEEMKEAYIELYELGVARSIEVWLGSRLVGGMYGLQLGKVFCGESMFSLESNASKFGFINFVREFIDDGGKLIDCQVYTSHLERLGAEEMNRNKFIALIREYMG